MTLPPIRLSSQAQRTAEPPISYFIQQAVENPRLISLAAGLVDEGSLPAAEVAEGLASVLNEPDRARAALQYGTTQGLASLREKLLARTTALDRVSPAERGLTAANVVITTGSQQLLYLVAEMLLEPGDLVITEGPSYFVFQGTLQGLGVRTLAVPMDNFGLDTDALEKLLQKLEQTGEIEKLKLIYVVDYFQNPTGLTLGLERRRKLVELAQRFSKSHRILILEDAAYRELRYDGPDLPSVQSFDRASAFVIQALTFSKPLGPGLKTGYGILPGDLVAPLLRIKGNHDFGSCNLVQHLLDRLLETGACDRHVEKLRQTYRAKRDALLQALAQEFPPGGALPVWWNRPDGGLYVWLTFPPEMETGQKSALMQAALKEGVLYVPGEFCYQGDKVPRHELRLSFGVASIDQIREGVRRLGKAVRRSLPGF